MCELLALSSSTPARLTFSLQTLAARGGASGSSHDGWGVAFYQGTDVALFREPAAADSALVRFLETEGPATHLAISHIRHATQGGVSLANTQPFVRQLGGRVHAFAHNGDLPGIYRSDALALGSHRPVGQTDSEHAFCALLERLNEPWKASTPPDPVPDDQGGASIAQEERSVVWIASVPLTDDDWRPLAEGEVVAVRGGEVLGSRLLAVR